MSTFITRIFTAVLLFPAFLHAQLSDFRWTKQGLGTATEIATQIATDGFGNEYVTGWFDSQTLMLTSDTLSNGNSSSDMMLLKYDFSGNLIWAKGVGSSNNPTSSDVVRARGLCCDPMGNIIVVGVFEGSSVTFGSTTLSNWNASSYTDEVFIAKYDPSGNVLWARGIHGTQDKNASSVVADANGNLYVTGEFSGATISFGPSTISNPGSPWSEIYLAKYDGAGNFLWARAEGGVDHDFGNAVAVDLNNNVVLTGNIGSIQVIIGNDTLSNPSNPAYDIITAKFSPSGNPLWARSVGGTYYEWAKSVACDQNGNVIVGGHIQSATATFANNTLNNPFAPYDCYLLMEYDSTGNELWARTGGLSNNFIINDIALDYIGNIYLSGAYDDSVITIGSSTHYGQGYRDIIVVKCDVLGNPIWSKAVGNTEHDEATSLCIDYGGSIYFTGYFSSYNIYFGPTMLYNYLPTCGSSELFVSCLDYTTGDVVQHQNALQLYPNPSAGCFTINGIYETYTYEIRTITGASTAVRGTNSPGAPIATNLAPGMYLVEITTSQKKWIETIVIQ